MIKTFILCLKAMVHVSTVYSNCDRYEIEEIVYPSPVDWRDAIEISEKIDPTEVGILQEKYVCTWFMDVLKINVFHLLLIISRIQCRLID